MSVVAERGVRVEGQNVPDPLSYLERDELDRFLALIRDTYPKAPLAALFLEQRSQQPTVSVPAITNIRDVLSHFSTFLRFDLTPEKRKEQLTLAKEHLRRSIHEPYEIAFLDNINHFIPLFQRYNEELLTAKDQHPFLSSAPTRANVEARLKEIYSLADAGRIAKGYNELNSSWEEGTNRLIGALDKLVGLVQEIEEHFYKFQSVTREASLETRLAEASSKIEEAHKHNIRWHRIAIVVAIVLFVLSSIFGEYKFHIVYHLTQLWNASIGLVFH
jgi:hypothetical protein